MLETKRILLKPVEEDDLKYLLNLQWDKDVIQLMYFKPLSMKDSHDWLKSLGKTKLYFSVFQKYMVKSLLFDERDNLNFELIGLASLNNIDRLHQRASFGIKLKTEVQGQGIGCEAILILLHYAFAHLNMKKIYGDRVKENIGSIKLTEKLGMKEEGYLRQHSYINGAFRDLTLVGILKDEFYAKNNDKLKKLDLL